MVAHAPTLPAASVDSSLLPKHIGPYAVVDVIGEGGMGVAYLARREEPVRRTVALKALKPEHGSAEVLARFQAKGTGGVVDREIDAAEAHLALGHALSATGDPDAAREAWTRALALAEPVLEGPGATQARPLVAELFQLLNHPGAGELVRELTAAGYGEPGLRRLAEARLPGGWPAS